MLESVTGGEVRGRYSIVGMKPTGLALPGPASGNQPRGALRWIGLPGAGRSSARHSAGADRRMRIDMPRGFPLFPPASSAILAMT